MAGIIIRSVLVLIRIVKLIGDLLGIVSAMTDLRDGLDDVDLLPGGRLEHAVIDAEGLVIDRDAGVQHGDDLAGAVGADRAHHRRVDHLRGGVRARLQDGSLILSRDEHLGNAGELCDLGQIGIVHRNGHAVEERGVLEVDRVGDLLLGHRRFHGFMLAHQRLLRVDDTLKPRGVVRCRLTFHQHDVAILFAGMDAHIRACVHSRRFSLQGVLQAVAVVRCFLLCRKRGGAERENQYQCQYHRQPSCFLHVFTPLLIFGRAQKACNFPVHFTI